MAERVFEYIVVELIRLSNPQTNNSDFYVQKFGLRRRVEAALPGLRGAGLRWISVVYTVNGCFARRGPDPKPYNPIRPNPETVKQGAGKQKTTGSSLQDAEFLELVLDGLRGLVLLLS